LPGKEHEPILRGRKKLKVRKLIENSRALPATRRPVSAGSVCLGGTLMHPLFCAGTIAGFRPGNNTNVSMLFPIKLQLRRCLKVLISFAGPVVFSAAHGAPKSRPSDADRKPPAGRRRALPAKAAAWVLMLAERRRPYPDQASARCPPGSRQCGDLSA